MDATSPDLDWLVSVDDHVIEPPNVWLDRLSDEFAVPAFSLTGETGKQVTS